MKHSEFISRLDNERIVAAIGAAEKRTAGQVRVFVSRKACPDALAMAKKHFKALKMERTRAHNAVLIFIAPKSRSFAIWGDTGIHERCGEAFWTAVRDEMTVHLKEGRYTDAVVHGIARAGEILAEHFPRGPEDLPDEITNDIAGD